MIQNAKWDYIKEKKAQKLVEVRKKLQVKAMLKFWTAVCCLRQAIKKYSDNFKHRILQREIKQKMQNACRKIVKRHRLNLIKKSISQTGRIDNKIRQ